VHENDIQPRQVRDLVRDQYEKYPYPRASDNLDDFIRSRSCAAGCPSTFFHWYWPYREPRPDLDILVAGCGTMQAVKLAVNLPAARITAIDISQNSLEHTNRLAGHHGIKNIETRLLAIEDAASLDKDFDLIVSTGVLHHLPDPGRGLVELRKILRPEGSMYLMVYGKYGRDGVYYLQDLFRRIGLSAAQADAETLAGMMQLIGSLPPNHPFTAKLQQFGRFDHPEELVDLFLHSQDRAYSIPELYAWLDAAGMTMQKLILRAHYAPVCSALAKSGFYSRIQELPLREQFAIGELFRAAATMHFFVACRADRPPRTHDTELTVPHWEQLVPVRNPAVEFAYGQLPPGSVAWIYWRAHQFPDIRYALDEYERQLFTAANGRRTLAEIAAACPPSQDPKGRQDYVRTFYSTMLDFDYVWYKGVD
jgi:SAM-dependent methyltransferase